jgi:hypothetical protein
MMNKKYLPVVVAVLCVFCVTFFISRPLAYAHEEAKQGDHGHKAPARAEKKSNEGEIVLEYKTDPAKIAAGVPTTIQFTLRDQKGNPVKGLSLHHDRILHVVIVGQDFSEFAHIHPEDLGPVTAEMKKAATFHVKYTFPRSGRYLIGVDFAVGDHPYSKHFLVYAGGQPVMGFASKDMSWEKKFGKLDVTLTSLQEHITVGKEMKFRYIFKKHDRPVTNIKPYLSAPMHISIVSADLTNFIHTHGELPGGHPEGKHTHQMHMMTLPKKFGPEIDFHAVFPASGLYVIFGQVEHNGEVVLTKFMVEVE